MSELTNKLWFKLVALIVLEAFFLTIADISWAGNYRENRGSQQMAMDSQKQKDERDKLSKDALNNQIVMTQPAMPYMGFGQITPKNGAQDISLIDTTINGLSIAGNDLPEIFRVLKNSGCAVSEAGFAAVRQGFDKKEIYHAMIKAGYDKEEVKTLLGSLLKAEEEKKQREEAQQEEKTGPPELGEATEEEKAAAEAILSKEKEAAVFEIPKVTDMPVEKEPSKVVERTIREDALLRQTVEFVRLMINEGKRGSELVNFLKKSGLTEERIVSALAQLGFSLKDIVDIFRQANISCSEIVQALQNALVNYSEKEIYNALLKCGFSDAEIIKAFKGAGMNAEDILKLTTELGRNMIEVAKAMISAGFSNGQIARAYVLKAMKWTWDQTVNMINCAVKAFDAFLTNIGRKFSSKEDLANALIIDDILATGEVQIQNKDVMTSMAAIRNVAKQYGVSLEGFKLGLESLKEIAGAAIVHLDADHWVTLESINDKEVTIIDNGKKKIISFNEFMIRWDGNTLALNQQKVQKDRLDDLQMREIRGGRGGILGFFEKVVKGIVNVVKAVVKAVVDVVVTVVKWVWNEVLKPILCSTIFKYILYVVAIVLACIGVGIIISALIMAFLQALRTYAITGSFSAAFKTFVISFVARVACAYLGEAIGAALSDAAGGAAGAAAGEGAGAAGGEAAGAIGGEAAGAVGGEIAGNVAGNVAASAATNAVTNSLTNIIISACVTVIKQMIVAEGLTYVMDAAGITNPYLRAAIIGACGALVGGSSFNYGADGTFTAISDKLVEEVVTGVVTQVSMEVVRQVGYEAGWDPLIIECASMAVGTVVNAAAGAAFGSTYSNNPNNKAPPASTETFGARFAYNMSQSMGMLIGNMMSAVVVRIGKENGWDPALTAGLSTMTKQFFTGVVNSSFIGGGLNETRFSSIFADSLLKGLGAAASTGYQNLLIRECGFSESDALFETFLVTAPASLSKNNVQTDDAMDVAKFMVSQIAESFGLTAGYNGNSFSRQNYLTTFDSEMDQIEYMMHGQEDIYWKGETAYNKKDDSVNVYWTRNYNKAKYDSEMKEKHPELYQNQGSGSGTSSNVGFWSAWNTTLGNRQTSWANTSIVDNLHSVTQGLSIMYTVSLVNQQTPTTGISAAVVQQGTQYYIQFSINYDAVKSNNLDLKQVEQNFQSQYGGTFNSERAKGMSGVYYSASDYYSGNAPVAYSKTTTVNNQSVTTYYKDVTIQISSTQTLNWSVQSYSFQSLMYNQNLMLVSGLMMNNFNNLTANLNATFMLSGAVKFVNGIFILENPLFTTADGSPLRLNGTLDNGDNFYVTVESGKGLSGAVVMDAKTGQKYTTNLNSALQESQGVKLGSQFDSIQAGLVLDGNANLQVSMSADVTATVNNMLKDINPYSMVNSFSSDSGMAGVSGLPEDVRNATLEFAIDQNTGGSQLVVRSKLDVGTSISVNIGGVERRFVSTTANQVVVTYNLQGQAIGIQGSLTNMGSSIGLNSNAINNSNNSWNVSLNLKTGTITTLSAQSLGMDMTLRAGATLSFTNTGGLTIVEGQLTMRNAQDMLNTGSTVQGGINTVSGKAEQRDGVSDQAKTQAQGETSDPTAVLTISGNNIFVSSKAGESLTLNIHEGNVTFQDGQLFTVSGTNNQFIAINGVKVREGTVRAQGDSVMPFSGAVLMIGNDVVTVSADKDSRIILNGLSDNVVNVDLAGMNWTVNADKSLTTTIRTEDISEAKTGLGQTLEIKNSLTATLLDKGNLSLVQDALVTDGITFMANITQFNTSVTENGLRIQFTQIGFRIVESELQGDGLYLGNQKIVTSVQQGEGDSKTREGKNVVHVHFDSSNNAYARNGEAVINQNGLILNNGDILQITGLSNNLSGFKANESLFTGNYMQLGAIKLVENNTYVISGNSVMTQDKEATILLTLAGANGVSVDTIMSMKELTLEGKQFYTPDFQNFSSSLQGMSFSYSGVAFTIEKQNDRFTAISKETVSASSGRELSGKLGFELSSNNVRLTINEFGDLVTAFDVKVTANGSQLIAGSVVSRIENTNNFEVIRGTLNLAGADKIIAEGRLNIVSGALPKTQDDNRQNKVTFTSQDPSIDVTLLGDGKYALSNGLVNFDKKTGISIGENWIVNVRGDGQTNNFVQIGDSRILSGSVKIVNGQAQFISNGSMLDMSFSHGAVKVDVAVSVVTQNGVSTVESISYKYNLDMTEGRTYTREIQGQKITFEVKNNNLIAVSNNVIEGVSLLDSNSTHQNVTVTVKQMFLDGTIACEASIRKGETYSQQMGTPSTVAGPEVKAITIAAVTEQDGNLIFSSIDGRTDSKVAFTTDISFSKGINIVYNTEGSYLKITNATIAGQYIVRGEANFIRNSEGNVTADFSIGTIVRWTDGIEATKTSATDWEFSKLVNGTRYTATINKQEVTFEVQGDKLIAISNNVISNVTLKDTANVTHSNVTVTVTQMLANGTIVCEAAIRGQESYAQSVGKPGEKKGPELVGKTIAAVTEQDGNLIFSAASGRTDSKITFITDVNFNQAINIVYNTEGSYLQVTNANIAGQFIVKGDVSFVRNSKGEIAAEFGLGATIMTESGLATYTEVDGQKQWVKTQTLTQPAIDSKLFTETGRSFDKATSTWVLKGTYKISDTMQIRNAEIRMTESGEFKSLTGDVYVDAAKTQINLGNTSLNIANAAVSEDGMINLGRLTEKGTIILAQDITLTNAANGDKLTLFATYTKGNQTVQAELAITAGGLQIVNGVYSADQRTIPGATDKGGTATVQHTSITDVIISGNSKDGYVLSGIVEVRNGQELIFNTSGARLTAGKGGLVVGVYTFDKGSVLVGDSQGRLIAQAGAKGSVAISVKELAIQDGAKGKTAILDKAISGTARFEVDRNGNYKYSAIQGIPIGSQVKATIQDGKYSAVGNFTLELDRNGNIVLTGVARGTLTTTVDKNAVSPELGAESIKAPEGRKVTLKDQREINGKIVQVWEGDIFIYKSQLMPDAVGAIITVPANLAARISGIDLEANKTQYTVNVTQKGLVITGAEGLKGKQVTNYATDTGGMLTSVTEFQVQNSKLVETTPTTWSLKQTSNSDSITIHYGNYQNISFIRNGDKYTFDIARVNNKFVFTPVHRETFNTVKDREQLKNTVFTDVNGRTCRINTDINQNVTFVYNLNGQLVSLEGNNAQLFNSKKLPADTRNLAAPIIDYSGKINEINLGQGVILTLTGKDGRTSNVMLLNGNSVTLGVNGALTIQRGQIYTLDLFYTGIKAKSSDQASLLHIFQPQSQGQGGTEPAKNLIDVNVVNGEIVVQKGQVITLQNTSTDSGRPNTQFVLSEGDYLNNLSKNQTITIVDAYGKSIDVLPTWQVHVAQGTVEAHRSGSYVNYNSNVSRWGSRVADAAGTAKDWAFTTEANGSYRITNKVVGAGQAFYGMFATAITTIAGYDQGQEYWVNFWAEGTNKMFNAGVSRPLYEISAWEMAGAALTIPAAVVAVYAASVVIPAAISAAVATVQSVIVGAATLYAVGATLGVGSAVGVVVGAVALKTWITIGAIAAISALSYFTHDSYMRLGDEIAMQRALGQEVSFGSLALFEAGSCINIAAGIFLTGGDVHMESVFQRGIGGSQFTWGHAVTLVGIAATIGMFGGFSSLKSIFKPIASATEYGWVKVGTEIAKQPFRLLGLGGVNTMKASWQAMRTSFGYMKVLNASLWLTGQMAVNYLEPYNPAAQVYQYVLSPFTAGTNFDLSSFINYAVIGDLQSNTQLAMFSFGMYVMSPLMMAMGASRVGRAAGNLGEVELKGGVLSRTTQGLTNAIIEEGVKERGLGVAIDAACKTFGLNWSPMAREMIVEFLSPNGPKAMRTNALTTTASISRYSGASEITVLKRAGVNTVGDLGRVAADDPGAVINYVQVNYHQQLTSEQFNTLTEDMTLTELGTFLNFNSAQMSTFIAGFTAGSGVTLGQIAAANKVELSKLSQGIGTEHVVSNVTDSVTVEQSAMLSGRTTSNVLEIVNLNDTHKQALNTMGVTDPAKATLSQISQVTGTKMETLVKDIGLVFVYSNAAASSTIENIAQYSGRSVEQVRQILADKFGLDDAKIESAKKLSNVSDFGAVSLGSLKQALGESVSVQAIVKEVNLTYQAPVLSNMMTLLQMSRVLGVSSFALIDILKLNSVSLSSIAGVQNIDTNKLVDKLNKIDGLVNVTQSTTVSQLFAQLESTFDLNTEEGSKAFISAKADILTTLDINLEAVAAIQGVSISKVAAGFSAMHSRADVINVTVNENGIFEYEQRGPISAQVGRSEINEQDVSVFAPSNTIRGERSFLNLGSLISSIKNSNRFSQAVITIQYKNGVEVAQFRDVDNLEATRDSNGDIIVRAYKNGTVVNAVAITTKGTAISSSEIIGFSQDDIARTKAQRLGLVDYDKVGTNITSLIAPNMRPKNLNRGDLQWEVNALTGEHKIVVAEHKLGDHEMVAFADTLTKIIVAFESVKTEQAIIGLVGDINSQLQKVTDSQGNVSYEISAQGMQKILEKKQSLGLINEAITDLKGFSADLAQSINNVLAKTGKAQIDSAMLKQAAMENTNEQFNENFIKFASLTQDQRSKFLQFIAEPTLGHEIGTGAGKTSYLIHLNAIAGLINGKNKAVIVLSDMGKLGEAYGASTKQLYDSLFGKGSHMQINANTELTDDLVKQVKKDNTKVVFTHTSVLGFMTDSMRVKFSVERNLFNALTTKTQIVQDEIHTIYGQNFIRGLGNDVHASADQKQATQIVAAFVRENAASWGVTYDAQTGFVDLSSLTIDTFVSEDGETYDVSPVFNNKFYAQLATHLNKENYLGRNNWTQQMLNSPEYLSSPELVHVRSVTKALARFSHEKEGTHWGVFDFGNTVQVESEGLGLPESFQNKIREENKSSKTARGMQVVPVSFGKLDVTRQFSDPYDALVKHEFGLSAHAFNMKNNNNQDYKNVTSRLNSVTTTPESTQANYLEFLSTARKNGADISSMTGTYNLIVGMMNSLGITVDRSERDELLLKYTDVFNPELRTVITNYLGISDSELFMKKSGLIVKNTSNLDTVAAAISEKFGVSVDTVKTELEIISRAEKGDFRTISQAMNNLLTAARDLNGSVTIGTITSVIVEASPFKNAQISSVNGVTDVKSGFEASIKSTSEGGKQNYVIVPEAEGLHQPNILQALSEHLTKLQSENKGNFRFVYHDSSDVWTLYEWDGKKFSARAEPLNFEGEVKEMLADQRQDVQTVILCNVGDVFGLDLKTDGRTQFVDIIDNKTLLTTALQGFGRMRGFENRTKFNERSVFVVGDTNQDLSGSIQNVFQDMINTENKEVRKITLQVVDDAIKHTGISLLKKMQDQAQGAPVFGEHKLLGHSTFAVGQKLGDAFLGLPIIGVALSTYAKSMAQHHDVQKKTGGITEYERIEQKLLRLWNQMGQDQDNSASKPQQTQQYLENRLAEVQKHFEDLVKDKEFFDNLSQDNKDMLQGFIKSGSQIFNSSYEAEIVFLNEELDKPEASRFNLFAEDNTLASIHSIISQTIKKSDLPKTAAFGHSKSSEVSTTLEELQSTTFAAETETEQTEQASFLEEQGLLRSDNTLTKTGLAYVNYLYKQIDNLPQGDIRILLAAIPVTAVPPEDKKNTGSIARGLVSAGYVDLNSLNENTVSNLVSLAYAVKLFADSLKPEALQALKEKETVSKFISSSDFAYNLQEYLQANISSGVNKEASQLLESAFNQRKLKNEISTLAMELDIMQSDPSLGKMAKVGLMLKVKQLKDKQAQLAKMQKENPITLEFVANLASLISKDAGQPTAQYQLARSLFAPDLTREKFEQAKETRQLLTRIVEKPAVSQQVKAIINSLTLDNLINFKSLAQESQIAMNDFLRNDSNFEGLGFSTKQRDALVNWMFGASVNYYQSVKMREANNKFQNGDIAAAIQGYNAVIEDPESSFEQKVFSRLMLADIYANPQFNNHNPAQAKAQLEAAKSEIESGPVGAKGLDAVIKIQVYVSLSDIYAKEGKKETRVQMLERAAEIADSIVGKELTAERAQVYFDLGAHYAQEQDYAKAETYLNKGIELMPEIGSAHYNLGIVYLKESKFDEAGESFTKAIEYLSNDDALKVDAYLGSVLTLKQKGKIREAEELMKAGFKEISGNLIDEKYRKEAAILNVAGLIISKQISTVDEAKGIFKTYALKLDDAQAKELIVAAVQLAGYAQQVNPDQSKGTASISSINVGNEDITNPTAAASITKIHERQKSQGLLKGEKLPGSLEGDLELVVDGIDVHQIEGQIVILVDADYLSKVEDKEQHVSAGLQRGTIYMTRKAFNDAGGADSELVKSDVRHEKEEVAYLRQKARQMNPKLDERSAYAKMSELLKDPQRSERAKTIIGSAHISAVYNEGVSYMGRGENERALDKFEEALDIAGSLEIGEATEDIKLDVNAVIAGAHMNIGTILSEEAVSGNTGENTKSLLSEAQEHFKTALEYNTADNAPLHYNLAVVQMRQGDFEESLSSFEQFSKAAEQSKEDSMKELAGKADMFKEQLSGMMKINQAIKPFQNAIDSFDEGFKVKDKDKEEAKKHYDTAIEQFKAIIESSSGDSRLEKVAGSAQFNLGLSYLQRNAEGDSEKAKQAFGEFIASVAGNGNLIEESYTLARAYSQANNIVERLENIKALEADEDIQLIRANADMGEITYTDGISGEVIVGQITGKLNKEGNALVLSNKLKSGDKEISVLITSKVDKQDLEQAGEFVAAGRNANSGLLSETERQIVDEIRGITKQEDIEVYSLGVNADNISGFANKEGKIFISEALLKEGTDIKVKAAAVFLESAKVYFGQDENKGLLKGMSSDTYVLGARKEVKEAAIKLDLESQASGIGYGDSQSYISALNEGYLAGKELTFGECALIHYNWNENGRKGKDSVLGLQDILIEGDVNTQTAAVMQQASKEAGFDVTVSDIKNLPSARVQDMVIEKVEITASKETAEQINILLSGYIDRDTTKRLPETMAKLNRAGYAL